MSVDVSIFQGEKIEEKRECDSISSVDHKSTKKTTKLQKQELT